MTPEEFEDNARIISGDPTWSLASDKQPMSKPFDFAITFGRFNLLHNGHLDLFKQMADSAGEIAIGVSTGPSNLGYRGRADVLLKAIKAAEFDVHAGLYPKLQPFDMVGIAESHDPSRVVFYVGEDQFKLAKAVSRVCGFATITIPRLTSSTIVRECIDSEDWDLLAGILPASVFTDVVKLHMS